MNEDKPNDRLSNSHVSPDDDEPRIYALQRDGGAWTLSRRGFLAGLAAAAASTGCRGPGPNGRTEEKETTTSAVIETEIQSTVMPATTPSTVTIVGKKETPPVRLTEIQSSVATTTTPSTVAVVTMSSKEIMGMTT